MSRTIAKLALALLPSTALAQQRCQWASLRSFTDVFIESQVAGDISDPIFSSPLLQYTQNGVPLTINSSASLLGTTPVTVHFSHTIVDQDQCASFTKLVVSTPSTIGTDGVRWSRSLLTRGGSGTSKETARRNLKGKDNEGERLLILGAQLRFNLSTSGNALETRVSTMDVVYAGEGDWKLDNATAARWFVEREDWGAISASLQDSRDTLEGVADAYLDFLGGSTASVPWDSPCARLEGSFYIAGNSKDTCVEGLVLPGAGQGGVGSGKAKGFAQRRYVMDQTAGSVSVFARDEGLGGAPAVFEFRVVQGRLRYVHQFVATATGGGTRRVE
ncbi:hypothetical protein N656DRAFT_783589 [Canariomyces notabilis]|uniref:DUF8021 domain-containing protein n=1 Tax=Canariomyces notabilis TaxID=2074819 RepID=A0AAN6QHL6_9PEZI|nr:hypothetical protein N656DRAFT_783589 [Canariomyces arenarius]